MNQYGSSPQASGQDYTQSSADTAEQDQQSFTGTPVGEPVQTCPGLIESIENIVLIPRKAKNIFRLDKSVRRLLPKRYPSEGDFIKRIEYNFYPDLNSTRTITAVVTQVPWQPEIEYRPPPRAGVTVYFALGGATAAKARLSAMSATTDAEGCASVDVTVLELLDTKPAIEDANVIEIVASFMPSCAAGNPSVTLTIHRNEDVDTPLATTESPDDFAATLQPVLDLQTWIVRQLSHPLASNGARAIQQLLNQVACRRSGGDHQFCKPDGQFDNVSAAETGRFISDFSAQPAVGVAAADAFKQRRFRVTVEENQGIEEGVKSYVANEYGSYTEGSVIDAHLLVGPQRWQRGGRIMDADGLLDLYTAVIWEFIQSMHERAEEYANAPVIWCRNPSDSGGTHAWPNTVSRGVPYFYGGARSLEEFQSDHGANFASPPDQLVSWFQYLRQNNSRIGLHQSGDSIVVPNASYTQYTHLETDPDIQNTAASGQPPQYVLNHPFTDNSRRQYSGIDCSAFCQRVASEARFRPGHCSDMAEQAICQLLPGISHTNGLPQNKLSTSSWPGHYRKISSPQWRRDVVFRGDLVNRPSSHIVILDTDNRATIRGEPSVGALWIHHACGEANIPVQAQAVWPQTECVRRVVLSPLRQWTTGWNGWTGGASGVEMGRIYVWD